jgi:methylated-DNA-[protein]-cysteine S-methyltransferase
MITRTLDTPLGPVRLSVARGAVVALAFDDRARDRDGERDSGRDRDPDRRAADAIARALHAWLDGDLSAVDDVDLAPDGTPFQRRVWDALRRIPPGTTTTYGAIARAIGTPHAARAVGAANAANPIAILVPCHRVVGADGALTGYAFGVERKRWLLAHERRFAGNIRALEMSSM